MPANGMRPHDGQKNCLMAAIVLRNPRFFKAELAIDHNRDGDNAIQQFGSGV